MQGKGITVKALHKLFANKVVLAKRRHEKSLRAELSGYACYGRGTRTRTQIDGFGDRCSTIELCPYGAENEIRTRDPLLGKEVLYH